MKIFVIKYIDGFLFLKRKPLIMLSETGRQKNRTKVKHKHLLFYSECDEEVQNSQNNVSSFNAIIIDQETPIKFH